MLADCFGLDKSDVEDQVEENPNSRYLIMKKGVSYEKAQEFEKIIDYFENQDLTMVKASFKKLNR